MKGDEEMREIKFRAKRLDNGKWVFGVLIPNSYGDRVFFIPLLLTDKIAYPFERLVDWVVEVMPETIGQYTGLKDKNGVEICEGDIVETVYNVEVFVGVVVYDLSEVDFKVTDGKEKYGRNFQYLAGNDENEVIGNIYENPELLETKKD